MPRTRSSLAKNQRSFASEVGPGAQRAADRPECRSEPSGGVELFEPGRGVRGCRGRCRRSWTMRSWNGGCIRRPRRSGLADAAGLGRGASGPEEEQARDAAVVVGRVQGGNPNGYQYSTFCLYYRRWRTPGIW